MKFTGKELFELGVPKKKIKFFIDKEFESKDALFEALRGQGGDESEKRVSDDPNTLFNFLVFLRDEVKCLPLQINEGISIPSNAELRRWIESKSVRVNGKFPETNEILEFPITDMVIFPKGKRKTTLV